MIVIDASIAVKWFIEEADSDTARAILGRHAGEIAVPALFTIEVAAALVRNGNIHKHATDAMREALLALTEILAGERMAVMHTSPAQLLVASQIALNLGHPLKDCIYLALAMQLDCALVTADQRFADKAGTACREVRMLTESP